MIDAYANGFRPSLNNYNRCLHENRFLIWEATVSILNKENYVTAMAGRRISIDSFSGLNAVVDEMYDLYCAPYWTAYDEAAAEAEEQWKSNYSDNIKI